MLTTPMDVLTQFPVRKSKAQKKAFRDAVQSYAESLGYSCSVEKGSMGVRNLVIGNPETAKYLVTAHYDTCAGWLVPNLLMPDNPLLYTLYQSGICLLLVLLSALIGFAAAFIAMIACGFTQAEPDDLMMGAWGIVVYAVVFLATLILCFVLVSFGPANQNNANDNTSGVVTPLEILRSLPENQRQKACYVLFDLNEAGLIGSRAYKKAHKAAIQDQIVLNLACVGDGDHMLMIPTQKLKKTPSKYKSLFKCCGYFGKKSLLVMDKGTSLAPSDHKNFPLGVCFMACRKGKAGHYISRIHTPKDISLDQTNVNLLRAAIISLICGDAA